MKRQAEVLPFVEGGTKIGKLHQFNCRSSNSPLVYQKQPRAGRLDLNWRTLSLQLEARDSSELWTSTVRLGMPMTNNKLVLTTAGSKEEAHKIAHALVERRLAACVNIVPQIESVYRWQGKIEESQEFLLLIKTFGTAIGRVCETIKELHSYEMPECIAFAIESGSLACLKWIDESVR